MPEPVLGVGGTCQLGEQGQPRGRECGLCIQKAGCALVHCWWEGKMVQLMWKTAWQFLKRLNTE